MGRKLFEKAGLIGTVGVAGAVARTDPADADNVKPRTAPGAMMGFLSAQSSAIQEAEQSRARLRMLEDAQPLRKLDPQIIKPSKWANRHSAAFATSEFEELKQDVAASGGNVQPIKVRAKAVLNGSTPGAPEYEIVYGHRRHRACLELGLPVLATVEEVDDVALFEQMERENRGRKNLSAWEQGMMYRTALDEGLYPSLRRLSEALNIDVSLVSKSVALARLPEAIIKAFASPLDIQFRWAATLGDVVQKDPDGALRRARQIAEEGTSLPPASVLARLIEAPDKPTKKGNRSTVSVRVGKKVVAVIRSDAAGRDVVSFAVPLTSERRARLAASLESLFGAGE